MPDDYADLIRSIAGPPDASSRVRRIAQDANISSDIAEDYLKTTQVESGHNVNVRNSPKGAQGFGQVMPDVRGGTTRTVGGKQYDLRDPAQNIEAGLKYFAEGGNDPVGRRLYYFGGPRARQHYERTGQIPNISDGNMTASQYVKATGGQQPSAPKGDEYDDLIRSVVNQTTQAPPSQAQPRTPRGRVTSTVTPSEPPPPEPIKFQPANSSQELNNLARGVQGVSEMSRLKGMDLPSNHPDLLGQHVEAKFDHQPTVDEVDSALMEQLGKGYGSVAQKFKADTGVNLAANAAIEKQPDGSYIVHARPTQGFINAVNAYARGGRSAYENTLSSQQVGKAAVARDIKTELQRTQGVAQDVGQAGAREVARTGQFAQNIDDLLTGRNPANDPNARAIGRAEESIPRPTTWTGSGAELGLGTLGTINRAEALGGGMAFPAEQAIENAHRGPLAAFKAGILAAPMMAIGPTARAIGAEEMSGLGRQLATRGIGAAELGGAAAITGASPREIASQAVMGGAFPIGARGEGERPIELGIGRPEGRRFVQSQPEIPQGVGENLARPESAGQVPSATPRVGATATGLPSATPAPASAIPTETTSVTAAGPKFSKLGLGVEAKAVEAKLTKGFEDLPTYDPVKVADQAQQAVDLLKSDPEKAKRIALGQERPEGNLLPESVFVAVENHALKNGDVDTIRNLATVSTLPGEATGMGQRIRMLGERNPDSAVGAIRDVQLAREAAAKKRGGNPQKMAQQIKTEVQVEMKKTGKDVWKSFLDDIVCK